jgi:hypothetical protein
MLGPITKHYGPPGAAGSAETAEQDVGRPQPPKEKNKKPSTGLLGFPASCSLRFAAILPPWGVLTTPRCGARRSLLIS